MRKNTMSGCPLAASGQSLSEYGVIFGLVVVVAIAAVVMLGNQSSDLLEESNRQLFTGQGGGTSRATALVSTLGSSNVPSVQLSLQDGSTLSFDRYPAQVSQSVQISGVDGTITLLSQTLKDLARQLKEQGKLSEDEYGKLVAMANQGHDMANVTGELERLAKNSGTKEQFANQLVQYEGMTIKPASLVCALGGSPKATGYQACDSLTVPYAEFTDIGVELFDAPRTGYAVGREQADFMRQYEEVSRMKAFQEDPQLAKVLKSLTRQISTLTQIAATTTSDITNINIPDKKPESFRGNVLSQATHLDSHGICNMGNTTDTGVHCPES